MSFLIDTIYNALGLTDAERVQVNTVLPAIKDLLDSVDAHLDDIAAADVLLANNGPLLNQLLKNWRVIGPSVSDAIADRGVDLFSTLAAYNNVKASLDANPKAVQSATLLYYKLAPLLDQAMTDMPKIKQAFGTMVAAAQRNKLSALQVVERFDAESLRERP